MLFDEPITRSIPPIDLTRFSEPDRSAFTMRCAYLSDEENDTTTISEGQWFWSDQILVSHPCRAQRNALINRDLFTLQVNAVGAFIASMRGAIEGELSRALVKRCGGFELLRAAGDEFRGFFESLDSYARLVKGWNGYSAPAPAEVAIKGSRQFLRMLQSENLRPDRVKPSSVGGIGITFKRGSRKSYVEFYNNGTVYFLLSEGDKEPSTGQVRPTRRDYLTLIRRIRDYVNG